MNSGQQSGIQQGVKSGTALSNMLSGQRSGNNSNMPKRKNQDPVVISSAINDCPFFYWNADNMTVSGTTVIGVTNILGTFNPLNQSAISSFTVASNPERISKAVFNNRAAIQFDTNDAFGVINTADPDMTNTSEMTLMMVCRVPTTDGIVLFNKTDEGSFPGIGTGGDLIVESLAGGFIVTYVGNTYASGNYVQWTISDAKSKSGDWVLLTIKARLKQPFGRGSELEICLNGTNNAVKTFGTITSFTETTWNNNYIIFGNGSSTVNGGSDIAAGFITEQWMNESEQLRLENYFRFYYGYKF